MLLSDIAYPRPTFAVSCHADGNMFFGDDSSDEISQNRLAFIRRNGLRPKSVAALDGIHSRDVREVGSADGGKGIFLKNDSLAGCLAVTKDINTFLFLPASNCLAMGFFDPVNHICALAKAGLEEVRHIVPRRVVACLCDRFEANPRGLEVFVSPAVGHMGCYFPDPLEFSDQNWDRYVSYTSEGILHVDWVRYALDQLLDAGIRRENIYSHYANEHTDHHFSRQSQSKGAKPAVKNINKVSHGVIAGWSM
jgi:copper oxidase (laccase) domain-containing protein